MKALILAAGEGQRFRPYTEQLPKPALPFCGYPLLYYSLYQLQGLGVSKLIMNSYHLPEKIAILAQNVPRCLAASIEISNESSYGKLLGSGGGIAYAQKLLQGEASFLVLNGDEVILPVKQNYMQDFLNYCHAQKPLACLLTTTHPEAGKKFGAVWVDQQNRVYGFGKNPPVGSANLKPLHFLGTQFFDEKIFSYLEYGVESNILYDALTVAIAKGEKVLAYPIDCYWHETGNLADFLVASEFSLKLLEEKFPYLINFFKHLGNEYSITKTKSSLVWAHKSAQIDNEALVSGFLIAGANTVVAKEAKLNNVVLNANYKVASSANLNNLLCL